ncbi:MAG: NAD-dependent epimerase/dehydratase family protein, partial [Candidatus Caldatribacteriaceae bacterium]
ILGSLNVFEFSVYHRFQRIVFASTGGAIYGEVETLPVGEDTLPQPLSPYGVAKFSVENYLEYYRKVWGLEYVALRYANVYGPRQNPEGEAGVIAIFSSQILQGKPCIVFGDGRKTRDYVYVEDIARANILALSSPSGVYNLGTGKETSVLELLELFQQVSAKKVHCSFSTERKGEVNRIALSFAKAQKILSWSPQVELSEGMRRTFFWLAEQFS